MAGIADPPTSALAADGGGAARGMQISADTVVEVLEPALGRTLDRLDPHGR